MAKLKAREKGTQIKMKVPGLKRRRKGEGGSNSQGVLSLETKRTTLRNTACLIYTLTLNVEATRRQRGRVVISALDS